MAEIQNGAVQNVAEVANAVVGLNAPAAANANVGAGKKIIDLELQIGTVRIMMPFLIASQIWEVIGNKNTFIHIL